MREARFLKTNADKWSRYELEFRIDPDPDLVASRFIEMTDDLAYARTFYPDSQSVRYLNGLTSRFYRQIYQNKKEKVRRIPAFWKFELPLLMYQYRRTLWYTLGFFLAFCLIGWISASRDDTFIRLILGDGYVNMTNENIAKGDPFGVYKHGNSLDMFGTIAFNNIMVSFFTYIMGAFVCVGTLFMLLRNGLMLGSFEYYFFSRHLGFKSVLVIFTHGTLEISALVIAGCAGLILGNSLLFPGTFSRATSLRKGGRSGLKVVVGVIPVFGVAAFFEGFVTRHTGMPVWLNIGILAGSLVFIIWYFVIYPLKLHRIATFVRASSGSTDKNINFQLWLRRNWNSGG